MLLSRACQSFRRYQQPTISAHFHGQFFHTKPNAQPLKPFAAHSNHAVQTTVRANHVRPYLHPSQFFAGLVRFLLRDKPLFAHALRKIMTCWSATCSLTLTVWQRLHLTVSMGINADVHKLHENFLLMQWVETWLNLCRTVGPTLREVGS